MLESGTCWQPVILQPTGSFSEMDGEASENPLSRKQSYIHMEGQSSLPPLGHPPNNQELPICFLNSSQSLPSSTFHPHTHCLSTSHHLYHLDSKKSLLSDFPDSSLSSTGSNPLCVVFFIQHRYDHVTPCATVSY